MTKTMTAAAALAVYDNAAGLGGYAMAAHVLADALRALAAPKAAKPKADKTPAEVIAAALAPVLAVVEKRATIPALTWVRLTCDGRTLTMRGTNLDHEVTSACPAFGLPELDLCLPAALLESVLRRAKGPISLVLEREDSPANSSDHLGKATLDIAGTTTRTACYKAGAFPMMAAPTFNFLATVQAADLQAALAPVSLSISTEESRYYLNGTFLHLKGGPTSGTPGVLRWVATDGHRMAYADMPGAEYAGEMPSMQTAGAKGVIVPLAAVEWMLKFCIAGEVTLEVCGDKIRASVDGLSLMSKVVDGSYPDYMRVMPRNNLGAEFTMGPDAIAVLGRLAANCKERARAIRFTIRPGSLLAELRTPQGEYFSAQIPATDIIGHGEIGFNAVYVMQALAHGAGRITLDDAASPALVTYPDDPNRAACLMPLRV